MDNNIFSFDLVRTYFPKILAKFPVNLNIVIVSMLFAFLLGTLISIARIRKIPVLNQLIALYISFIRGTPIMVQMFLIYYGLPQLVNWIAGKNITDSWNKIIYVYVAYSLNNAGYLAEYIRSAILAVPFGQTEAGLTIGMNRFQVFVHVVFPQAFRIMLPGLSYMFISLIPATSLAYMVGTIDMMGRVQQLSMVSFHTLEGYFCVAVIMVLASLILEVMFRLLIRRFDYGNARKIRGQKTKKGMVAE